MADHATLIGCNTLDRSVRSRSGALTKLAGVIRMAAYLGVVLAGGAAAHEYPTSDQAGHPQANLIEKTL